MSRATNQALCIKAEPGIKSEPGHAPKEVEADEIVAMIGRETTKYNKERISDLADIVRNFFRRNADTHFTMYCFENVLSGFQPGTTVLERARATAREAAQPYKTFRSNQNKNKELLRRWEKLQPTDVEKKIVWASLTECGFLRKSANETYFPDDLPVWFRGKSAFRQKFIHVTDVPDTITNWEW